MIAIALGFVLGLETNNAKDYFVSKPGAKFKYTETDSKGRKQSSTDTVEAPMIVLTRSLIPIVTTSGSRSTSTYYSVTDTMISIAAFDISKPLKEPVPVLQLENGKGSWDYEMIVKNYGDANDVTKIHGEARMIAKRKFEKGMYDAIEVKLTSQTGGGKTLVEDTQTCIYLRGVGLVEMTSESKFGRETARRTLRLESREVPPGS